MRKERNDSGMYPVGDMGSLAESIARVEAQLRFIPAKTLRQARILALLNQATRSNLSGIHLHDELGRFIGGTVWPLQPARLLKMAEVGPSYNALALCNDIYEQCWDHRPNIAFGLPESLYLNSLLYEFVYQPLDCRHTAIYAYPERTDGSQVVVFPSRGHQGTEPYGPGELRIIEQVCAHFALDLSNIERAGPILPRLPALSEHGFALDGQLRPSAMPLYAHALLSFFYSSPKREADGKILLPVELEQDIMKFKEESLRATRIQSEADGFFHAFTKAHRGRMLCLAVQSDATKRLRLTVHEDLSQHVRLRRLKAACQVLKRDRSTIFSVCLVLAEGVRDHAEIIRRARLSAHKPSSALRIISRARSIIAEN